MRITCRSSSEGEVDLPAAGALAVLQRDIEPWRRFRWRHGQRHYSGLYWSSTTSGHVAYESRLELTRLLMADFDRSVCWIVAQPFLVEAVVEGVTRRHVPDFVLVDTDGLVTVVNVKPSARLADPKGAHTMAWAEVAFARRGWRHEIWSGVDAVVLANLRFLCGYRRPDRFDAALVDAVLGGVVGGETLEAAEERSRGVGPSEVVRPALLHLLWVGALVADLSCALSGRSLLERAG